MDETAALRATWTTVSAAWPQPNGTAGGARAADRQAYLEGAEEWSRETTGRGLTEGELEGVVRRFR